MFEAQIAKLTTSVVKNAPQLLFTGGIITGVASTVAACRATLKASEVLEQCEKDKILIHSAERAAANSDIYEYNKSRDTLVLYIKTVGRFTKLYAPSLVLGVASVAMLTKSHRILNERNAGLAAALTATTKAFDEYRKRVVDEYGADKDRELRHGKVMVDEPIIDKNGNNTGRTKQVAKHSGTPSMYGRFFGRDNSNWTHGSPETNAFFLKCQQTWANDMLQVRGHVFLNEIYDTLGMERSSAGAVVGWVKGEGDGHIDFGMWRDDKMEEMHAFMTGAEDGIWLDFNVQGSIWDRI